MVGRCESSWTPHGTRSGSRATGSRCWAAPTASPGPRCGSAPAAAGPAAQQPGRADEPATGLHVSPEGNADNPFLTINPGETFDYDYQLPTDHPAGTFWCHPHLDGSVADQLFAGLYGAIVVEEDNPVPVARERVLVISGVLRRPGNRPPPLPHGPDDGPRGRPAAGQRPGHTGARGPPGRAGTLARRQRLHVPLPAARRRRLQLLEMVER